jgi:uncharacterized protein YbaR (Trm112 family)
MLEKELLEILACPVCKTDVQLEDGKIVCTKCGRRYPIRDGIPVMLTSEATTTQDREEKTQNLK